MIESDFPVFEAVGALVVVLDDSDRIVYWNHACSDLTGYSRVEVIGRALWEFLLAPEEVERVKLSLATVRAGPGPSRVAYHWIKRTGERRWISWSNTLAIGPGGHPRYLVNSGIDATERRQAEVRLTDELAYHLLLDTENARALEHAERYSHDQREANEQMVRATIHAQVLMEESEAARASAAASELELRLVAEFRERFIGILGHDLRNPLAAINVNAGLLLRGQLDERDERRVARIINSSQRMTRMISQLLDLTRSRLGGGFPLDLKWTDLRDVSKSVAEEFGEAIELRLEGDLSGNWDSDRLTEALSNIAGNAIEHATRGTAIVLSARDEGAKVVVEVVNQGDPIPAELVPVMFEPFRRGAEPARSAFGSLGLGLYIAKQIVVSMGGTIDGRSAGGMTRFVIRLPKERPVPAPIPSPLAGRPDRRIARADRRVGDRRKPAGHAATDPPPRPAAEAAAAELVEALLVEPGRGA